MEKNKYQKAFKRNPLESGAFGLFNATRAGAVVTVTLLDGRYNIDSASGIVSAGQVIITINCIIPFENANYIPIVQTVGGSTRVVYWQRTPSDDRLAGSLKVRYSLTPNVDFLIAISNYARSLE